MPLSRSDMKWIEELVDEDNKKKEAAAGINQKAPCSKCNKNPIHRTCGSCKKVQCKDCVQHWPCPRCNKYFYEKECCKGRSKSTTGLYWCDKCGVICTECLPCLYEDYTLMDTCCAKCQKLISPFYAKIKRAEKKAKGRSK